MISFNDLKAIALTLIFNFRHNHGWLFAFVGYLLGAIAMLRVLEAEGYL